MECDWREKQTVPVDSVCLCICSVSGRQFSSWAIPVRVYYTHICIIVNTQLAEPNPRPKLTERPTYRFTHYCRMAICCLSFGESGRFRYVAVAIQFTSFRYRDRSIIILQLIGITNGVVWARDRYWMGAKFNRKGPVNRRRKPQRLDRSIRLLGSRALFWLLRPMKDKIWLFSSTFDNDSTRSANPGYISHYISASWFHRENENFKKVKNMLFVLKNYVRMSSICVKVFSLSFYWTCLSKF